MSGQALIVFARAPRVGAVKTRLAAVLGERPAALVYARLLARSLWLARHWQGPRYLACADRRSLDYFLECLPTDHWSFLEQSGHDLGERMHNAFAHVLTHAPAAVLMGSDIADATVEDLQAASDWLAGGTDVVLGPVLDGGYWLMGLRQAHAALFAGLPWSTSAVAALTRARCATLGLQREELPLRHDVDDLEGLQALVAQIEAFEPLPLME